MDAAPLADQGQALANDVLVWVGFGTLVGLLAKGIMPGRDPGGSVATLAMGIAGSVIGCGVLAYFHDGPCVTARSARWGFAVATGGAFILLFFYRLLAGYFFVEGDARSAAVVPAGDVARRQAATITMNRPPFAAWFDIPRAAPIIRCSHDLVLVNKGFALQDGFARLARRTGRAEPDRKCRLGGPSSYDRCSV